VVFNTGSALPAPTAMENYRQQIVIAGVDRVFNKAFLKLVEFIKT